MAGTGITAVTRWYCPNKCGKEDVTTEPRAHTRFHTCPKLRFVWAPLVPVGTEAKVELVEREDYVGREHVRTDPELGRPIMAVKTTRADGQDLALYLPTAKLAPRANS